MSDVVYQLERLKTYAAEEAVKTDWPIQRDIIERQSACLKEVARVLELTIPRIKDIEEKAWMYEELK